ncbi:hypothetical protein [Arthrobacter sp. CAN_A1]|uniref:hypothetical protein n=1 Tax=Arthrobacter sp. CAN_A1 TaxID=2787717 RepID=UPI0018CA1A1F
MSTPTPPVPRLPNKPTSLPAVTSESVPPRTAAEAPAPGSTSPVLERLRAGRPAGVTAPGTAADTPAAASPVPQSSSTARTPPEDAVSPSGPAGNGSNAPRAAARRVGQSGSAVVKQVGSWDPDLVRRIAVTVVVLGAGLGAASTAGAFGGPDIRGTSLGTFDPEATLISPAAPAHYLWLLIGVGLLGYTAHQWLPSQRRSPRHRGLGWLVAAATLMTAAWALSVQRNLGTASLVTIVLLLATLVGSLRWLNHYPAQTRREGALVDVPLGLFLGWAGVTTAVQIAAVLTTQGVDWLGWGAQRWALAGIVLLTLAAMAVCMTDRGRIAVALAVGWGLACVVPVRLFGDLQSTPVAFAAGLGVFLLIISAGSRRHRVDHAYRRELRARQMATVAPIDFYDDGEPAEARP